MTRRITAQSQSVANGLGIQSGGYVYTTPSSLPGTGAFSQALTAQSIAAKASLAEAFKPKRAGKNPNLSHIIFILDDSGSMQSCRKQTIDGFNEYLKGQQTNAAETGIETLVSLYKFDGSRVTCTIDRKKVSEVEPLNEKTYNPQGGTNLNDAMGGVMMQINNALAAKKKDERESVIITVLTDGEENASRTFRSDDVKQMVEKAEGKNWGFMFLGANIDAFHAGSALGFNVNNTMQFATANATETIRAASDMTSRMKMSYSKGLDTQSTYASTAFTAAERAAAVGKDNE
jgi:hypothetical protein